MNMHVDAYGILYISAHVSGMSIVGTVLEPCFIPLSSPFAASWDVMSKV
jgi:hypothetical protein